MLDKVIRFCRSTAWTGCALAASYSGCTALVELPTGTIDVSRGGVIVDFPGVDIDVTRDDVYVNAPGVYVEIHNDRKHDHDHDD